MSAVDYAAFFVPLIFIGVLWHSRDHFRTHRLALSALVLLTVVSILHFDVGMLTEDPYDALLDDIGAPRRTWTASVVVLMVVSYSGGLRMRLWGSRKPRERGPRRGRAQTRS